MKKSGETFSAGATSILGSLRLAPVSQEGRNSATREWSHIVNVSYKSRWEANSGAQRRRRSYTIRWIPGNLWGHHPMDDAIAGSIFGSEGSGPQRVDPQKKISWILFLRTMRPVLLGSMPQEDMERGEPPAHALLAPLIVASSDPWGATVTVPSEGRDHRSFAVYPRLCAFLLFFTYFR